MERRRRRRKALLVVSAYSPGAIVRPTIRVVLAGKYLNDVRVVLNNLAPGAQMSMLPARPGWVSGGAGIVSLAAFGSLLLAAAALTIGRIFKLDSLKTSRISRCDPACLNVAGRLQLDSAARHEQLALVWVAAGLAAVVLLSCLDLA